MKSPTVKIEPKVIGAIRSRFGVSNQELARLIHLSRPDEVDEWETGRKQPTLRQAENLVEQLGISILDLFHPELPPDRLKGIADFRSGKGEESVKRRVALEEALYLQDEYLRLVGATLDDVGDRLPRAKGVDDLGRLVTEVRSLLGISTAVQIGWRTALNARTEWRDALERFGFLVFHLRHVPAAAFRAFSIFNDKAPVIAVNSEDGVAAHIFSYFHEMGHMLLRSGGTCDSFAGGGAAIEVEAACNRFAADFLVPKEDLTREANRLLSKSDLPGSVALLSEAFSVSRQVMALRLGELDMVPQAEVARLFRTYGAKQFVQPEELVKGKSRIPYNYQLRSIFGARFLEGVLSSIDSGALSLTDGLGLVRTNEKHLAGLRKVV